MSEAASVRPIEALSVVDRVATELRHAIVRGSMRPGQEFSLREIAGQLGVSFIPVREALRTLEAEGLLVTRRGRSAVVAPLDASELAGLCQLRKLIEPDLNARSCVLIQAAELDRLEESIRTLGPANGRLGEDFPAYLNWYKDMLAPAATSWDYKVLERLWLGSTRYLYVGYSRMNDEQVAGARADTVLHDLVEVYRSREPERVREFVSETLDRIDKVAQLGLD
jgi:DNA-binding GntR family transcriptional regulator